MACLLQRVGRGSSSAAAPAALFLPLLPLSPPVAHVCTLAHRHALAHAPRQTAVVASAHAHALSRVAAPAARARLTVGARSGAASTPSASVRAATAEGGVSSSTAPSCAPACTEAALASDAAAPCSGDSSKAVKPLSRTQMYLQLSKARLSSLVVFTTGAGYLMAGPPVDWVSGLAVVAGTSMAAAAAGTFNQVWEVRSDGLMMRTRTRPLPSGRVSVPHALAFGGALTLASTAVLALGTNPLVTAMGVGNIALYSVVYTPLKTMSVWNTALGALVGAIPPLMGWAAATGGLMAYEPLFLAATLFWWQFPHFHSLAWTLRKDYARGGYAMVPVTDTTGGRRTAWLCLRSALALSALPVAAWALGTTSAMFAVEGALVNAIFLSKAWAFYRAPSDASARKLFLSSLWILPLLLAAAVFHSVHWQDESREVEVARQLNADTLNELLIAGVHRLRETGRELCVHERAVRTRTQEAAHSLIAWSRDVRASIAATLSGSAQGSAQGSAAAAHEETSVVASAEAAAKGSTRAMCPVVVMEEASKSAAEARERIVVVDTPPAAAAAHTSHAPHAAAASA